MKYWLEYVRASYEIIMLAEQRSSITLEHEVEAFVVHTLARYMENPNIPTDSISIKIMTAVNQKGNIRKQKLQEIAEECILINGFGLNNRRWPSSDYYSQMGKLALEHRAWSDRPPELFYERIAYEFDNIGKILHKVNVF